MPPPGTKVGGSLKPGGRLKPGGVAPPPGSEKPGVRFKPGASETPVGGVTVVGPHGNFGLGVQPTSVVSPGGGGGGPHGSFAVGVHCPPVGGMAGRLPLAGAPAGRQGTAVDDD